jgi:hypothetical protein
MKKPGKRARASKAPKGSFDDLLASYQKWSLVSFYPALLTMMVSFFGLSGSKFVYIFSCGFLTSLSGYFASNPLNGSATYSNLVCIGVSFLFLVLSFFLSQAAAKAKFSALVMACVLYILDTVYLGLLIIPSFPGALSPLYYGLSLGVHAIFLTLYALVFLSYGKLWRFQNEINQKHAN